MMSQHGLLTVMFIVIESITRTTKYDTETTWYDKTARAMREKLHEDGFHTNIDDSHHRKSWRQDH